MKALRMNDYGAPLHVDEVAVPTPGPGQVLVENYFTTMNGVDPGRGLGFLRQVFPLEFPWTPGGDVAGRVAASDALYEEIGRLKVELDWLKKKVGMLD